MEHKNKAENGKDMEYEDKRLLNNRLKEKDNEIHQLSVHQVDMINQLNSANQEVVNLRTYNDGLKNDQRAYKETNERMMRSQESMDQLAKLSQK